MITDEKTSNNMQHFKEDFNEHTHRNRFCKCTSCNSSSVGNIQLLITVDIMARHQLSNNNHVHAQLLQFHASWYFEFNLFTSFMVE